MPPREISSNLEGKESLSVIWVSKLWIHMDLPKKWEYFCLILNAIGSHRLLKEYTRRCLLPGVVCTLHGWFSYLRWNPAAWLLHCIVSPRGTCLHNAGSTVQKGFKRYKEKAYSSNTSSKVRTICSSSDWLLIVPSGPSWFGGYMVGQDVLRRKQSPHRQWEGNRWHYVGSQQLSVHS